MIRFYALMCVLGFVLPYSALGRWLLVSDGISIGAIWNSVVANGLSAMAWLDVVVTAIVVVAFVRVEGRQMNMSGLAPPILGTCLVGPSFGLPLFLFLRERERTRQRFS